MRIKSKGKGKSGGAGVITYVETEIIGIITKEKTVNLIAVYDKSETSTISGKELKELIKYL